VSIDSPEFRNHLFCYLNAHPRDKACASLIAFADAHSAQHYEVGLADGREEYRESFTYWKARGQRAEASLARLVEGVESALSAGRGTSGRIILDRSQEEALRALLLEKAEDCTEPNRATCPRHCQDFCNAAETAKATPAPAMGEELPQLPRPSAGDYSFNADQMHAYGRACMALRQPAYDDFAAKRLRLVAEKLGLGAAIPADNFTLWGCAFAVLGQIRRAIDGMPTSAAPVSQPAAQEQNQDDAAGLPPIELDSLATFPSPHGTLVRRADVECMLARLRPNASTAPATLSASAGSEQEGGA
jgi:hypothetical protein